MKLGDEIKAGRDEAAAVLDLPGGLANVLQTETARRFLAGPK
jgi:hypothetical protein